MDLKQYVSEVKDWPSAGVSFKDITTIMDNGEAYGYATDQIVEYAKEKNIDIVVGPEARGFIIGCQLLTQWVLDLLQYVKKENYLEKLFVMNII